MRASGDREVTPGSAGHFLTRGHGGWLGRGEMGPGAPELKSHLQIRDITVLLISQEKAGPACYLGAGRGTPQRGCRGGLSSYSAPSAVTPLNNCPLSTPWHFLRPGKAGWSPAGHFQAGRTPPPVHRRRKRGPRDVLGWCHGAGQRRPGQAWGLAPHSMKVAGLHTSQQTQAAGRCPPAPAAISAGTRGRHTGAVRSLRRTWGAPRATRAPTSGAGSQELAGGTPTGRFQNSPNRKAPSSHHARWPSSSSHSHPDLRRGPARGPKRQPWLTRRLQAGTGEGPRLPGVWEAGTLAENGMR